MCNLHAVIQSKGWITKDLKSIFQGLSAQGAGYALEFT